MSPATYNGPLPANPSHQMKRLDDEGQGYWIEDLSLIDGFKIERADVMSHNPDWLTIRENTRAFPGEPDGKTWTIRTAHIVRFRIVEG